MRELLTQLRELGEEPGRAPTAKDLRSTVAGRRRSRSSGTPCLLTAALREAGFDVPVGEERLERAIAQGAVLARDSSAGCRRWRLEGRSISTDPSLLSEWQVYRMVDVNPGAWSAFQFLVRERLREEGVTVRPDGALS